jgi:hypothetical protein
MNTKGFFLIVIAMAVVITGCGGTDAGKNSSQALEIALLQVDGEYLVEGTVFHDVSNYGTMDSTETGIEGVEVELTDTAETTIDSTSTNADGYYAFVITVTGPYSVSIVEPEGYLLTTTSPVGITVTDADVPLDFGLRSFINAPVDVKPGSDVNPLNLKSNGVLPVAILGSDSMDAAMIDPASLLFNGVSPLRWSYEDVWSHDGYEDMVLKFSTPEIAASLGGVQSGDIVTLTMEGYLFDGTMVLGDETVWIVQIPK